MNVMYATSSTSQTLYYFMCIMYELLRITPKSSQCHFHFIAEGARGSDHLNHQAGLTHVEMGIEPRSFGSNGCLLYQDWGPQYTIITRMSYLVYVAEVKYCLIKRQALFPESSLTFETILVC